MFQEEETASEKAPCQERGGRGEETERLWDWSPMSVAEVGGGGSRGARAQELCRKLMGAGGVAQAKPQGLCSACTRYGC